MTTIDVLFPTIRADETLEEFRWLASRGDYVENNQIIAEVETSQVVLTIPSPVTGYLSDIPIQAEQRMASGQVIASICPFQKL